MKVLSLILLFFSTCILISCDGMGGGVEGSPDETIKGFVEKLKAQDFDGAKTFTDANTDATMDFLKNKAIILKEMSKTDELSTMVGGVDFAQVKVEPCVVTDKKATCKCCEEITGNCQEINVVQEGNKWLVSAPKESSN